MVVSYNKLIDADSMFKSNKKKCIGEYAPEMNNKHKAISVYFLELEKKAIPGCIVDELMLSVLIIWYVIEKCYYKRIAIITEEDININIKLYNSRFNTPYAIKSGASELSVFIEYEENIFKYAIFILEKYYKDIEKVPHNVLVHYLSAVKCFEDKLEYTRKREKN